MRSIYKFSALAFSLVISSCITLDGGPPYGFNESTGRHPDTPENRKYFIGFIEMDLQGELRDKESGNEPRNWEWRNRFISMRKSKENPHVYIEYFHRRRRELGLYPMPEI